MPKIYLLIACNCYGIRSGQAHIGALNTKTLNLGNTAHEIKRETSAPLQNAEKKSTGFFNSLTEHVAVLACGIMFKNFSFPFTFSPGCIIML